MPIASRTLPFSMLAFVVAAAVGWACGGDDEHDDSPDQAGAVCEHPEDCYPNVDHDELAGDVECLDRVPAGYCTHLCVDDSDCCAVEDECETDLPQLCAPFESAEGRRCFLSCEGDVIGDAEENDYCHEHVGEDFGCRSSGGGDPKKVCTPN